jgi:hypothetical protein
VSETENNFFPFPTELNEMLIMPPNPFKLYMRMENIKMAEKFERFMRSEKLLFVLQGPPGVGKL